MSREPALGVEQFARSGTLLRSWQILVPDRGTSCSLLRFAVLPKVETGKACGWLPDTG